MGFKQKSIFTKSGLSRRSSSPLNNLEGAADLANLDYTDTDFTADLNGKKIALQGEAVIPGQKVEKQLVPEDFDGGENNPEYQKKLAALKTAIEQGKADKYKDQKVVRKRDYTQGLLEKYGRYYKEDQRGRKHVVHPIDSGEYLSISEAKKHFGGEDTPGYIKWFKNHPTAGWATAKPGYGFETDYEPEFKSNENLTDYTYKINE